MTHKLWSIAIGVYGLGFSGCVSAPGDVEVSSQLSGDYNNYLQVWQQKTDEQTAIDPVFELGFALSETLPGWWRAKRQTIGVPEASVTRWLTWSAGGQHWSAYRANSEDGREPQLDQMVRDEACDTHWVTLKNDATTRPNPNCGLFEGFSELTLSGLTPLGYTTLNARRNDAELVLKKARHFKGWMGVKKQRVDPEAGDDEWIFVSDFRIHNEGQVVRLVDKDGVPSGFAVQLERLVYQNTRTPVLKLGLIEESQGKTIHYIWSEPGSRLLGMNLRWFQVGLTSLGD